MRRFVLAPIAALVILGTSALAGCGGKAKVSSTGGGGAAGAGGDTGAAGGDTGGSGGTGGSTCTPSKEVCDGMDNNCDGKVDEGCPCKQGDMQPCYTGDPATKDKGACKSGTQACDLQGKWGACMGDLLPKKETCNNIDDDCNGVVDDMGMTTCGVGACAASVVACQNGQMNPCVPGMPTLEVCDGVDNNCNQLIDESDPDLGKVCDSGLLGACKAGKEACLTANGKTALSCVPNIMPGMEICDGIDNDCNGVVDDNVPGTGAGCSTGLLGPCSMGTVSCQNNVIDCYPLVPPSKEVCDGVDNDCNGNVDDLPGANMACDTGKLGACKAGINQCKPDGSFGCVQQVQAQPTDVCGDNIDNDCNGIVDDNCLFQFTGVMINLPIAQLVGWQQCFIDSYSDSSAALSTILGQCTKNKLLLGCRPTGSATLQVAANGLRTDVTFDTGTGNVTHDANGVSWYYNSSYSWGFAPQGDPVTRNSCDTTASSLNAAGTDGNKRLCWHTSGGFIQGGWRCGTNDSLNASAAFERIVYQAD